VLAPFKKANPGVTVKYQGAGDNTPQIVSTAIAHPDRLEVHERRRDG